MAFRAFYLVQLYLPDPESFWASDWLLAKYGFSCVRGTPLATNFRPGTLMRSAPFVSWSVSPTP